MLDRRKAEHKIKGVILKLKLPGIHLQDAEMVLTIMERGVLFRMKKHVLGALSTEIPLLIKVGGVDLFYSVGQEIHQLFVAAPDSQGHCLGAQAPELSQPIEDLAEFPDLPVKKLASRRKQKVACPFVPQRIPAVRNPAEFVQGQLKSERRGGLDFYLIAIERPEQGMIGSVSPDRPDEKIFDPSPEASFQGLTISAKNPRAF
jgi:hypothetical protein